MLALTGAPASDAGACAAGPSDGGGGAATLARRGDAGGGGGGGDGAGDGGVVAVVVVLGVAGAAGADGRSAWTGRTASVMSAGVAGATCFALMRGPASGSNSPGGALASADDGVADVDAIADGAVGDASFVLSYFHQAMPPSVATRTSGHTERSRFFG